MCRCRLTMKNIRKLTKIVIFTLVLVALPAVFAGVKSSAAESGKPTFTVGAKTLYVGFKSYYSELSLTEETAVITYKSSDKKVAIVDEDGKITGVAPGTADITAVIRQNGKKYKTAMKVTVKNPYSKLSASTEGLAVGSSFRFELTRYGHREPVTWTLDGAQYASIKAGSSTDCILTGIAPGFVTLRAETNGSVFTVRVRICEGTGKVYFISPDSDPYYTSYKKYSTYNKYTKHYYLLRSYLEYFDKAGGGILVLKAGTYTITNTLCIPSNTTILLEDGAKIVKSYETGTSSLTYTRSLFQTVSYTNSSKTGVFSGYNGEKNINILGEGNATIDLNDLNCAGVVAAHCSNLKISGIRFLNMHTNHFIELDASYNVTISGNYFSGYSQSSTTRKEAINLDTPDLETGGFSQNWTSYDGTPNSRVTIVDNVFYNLESAIGTHKYTEDKQHSNITIARNTFIDMHTYAVRCMNWKNSTITDNYIVLLEEPEEERIGIICNGMAGTIIKGNRFERYTIPISLYHWQNQGSGSVYAPIYNELDADSILALRSNYVYNCKNNYVEYYSEFDNFSSEKMIKCKIFESYIIE